MTRIRCRSCLDGVCGEYPEYGVRMCGRCGRACLAGLVEWELAETRESAAIHGATPAWTGSREGAAALAARVNEGGSGSRSRWNTRVGLLVSVEGQP